MSSKNKNTIRFAVGTPDNSQSWIWRLWVQGDEVYFGAKNAFQAFKVSLHKSGIWRIAFVKELKREDEVNDRVIIKWNKPEEFAPGWTPSVAVVVSSIKPERPFSKIKIEDKRILWVPEPENGKRLVFKLLFSTPEMSDIDLKRVLISGDKLIGKLVKNNGEKVWLVLREDNLSLIEITKIKDVMRKTKIHLKPDSSEDSIHDSRAILVVSEDVPTVATQPTILDISLGKENIKKSS
jgi:hypothetical protein